MKKILSALLVLAAQQAWAQHATTETLFSSKSGKKTTIGAYGAPAAKFTPIDGKFGLLTGGYGGVLLNGKIMLGAGAYSLVNNVDMPAVNANAQKEYLNLWYTGFVAEYIHNSDKLVHWTAGALIGGGAAGRRNKNWWDGDDHDHTYDNHGFFVAEPYANVELNITKFLRLDVGASYRYVGGSNTTGITDGKLGGPSLNIGLKAGKF
ncbi:hypothetical protein [Chitinophaga ginsengisoli]|uniref:Outer membrane protein with beta-barrel domain n=1 Tax=Chitinophaga ginsengisoli TaxID=363837 RepID=A0A2P8GDZ3_9BACT|nr:hypothetical protein [Chitinophaga ginsengisoli]PSL32160.1 hypothetical protein CLV42_104463 [Chitinophaga ginsengisoli]